MIFRKLIPGKEITICLIAVLLLFSYTSFSYGDWLQTWLNSVEFQTNGPSSYQGSVYHGINFGSISIRFPSMAGQTIRPITFEPPGFRVGCGGVDVWMGSFSVMKIDQLLSRSKQILTAAASYTFRYALEKLCPTCVNVLNALDAASNILNSLSLNTCEAGRVIAAAIVKGPNSKDVQNFISKFKKIKGEITSYWDTIENSTAGEKQDQSVLTEMMGNCSEPVRELLAYDSGICSYKQPCSLLDLVYQVYFGGSNNLSWGMLSLLRGLAGDVILTLGGNSIKAVYHSPPKWNKDAKISTSYFDIPPVNSTKTDYFPVCLAEYNSTTGNLFCYSNIDTSEIYNYVENALGNIYKAFHGNNTTINKQYTQFLYAIYNTPVYSYLLMSYTLNLPLFVKESSLVKCAYDYYVYGLLTNALYLGYQMNRWVDALTYNCNKNPRLNVGCYVCDPVLYAHLRGQIYLFNSEVAHKLQIIYAKFQKAVSRDCSGINERIHEINSVLAFMSRYTAKTLALPESFPGGEVKK